MATPLHLLIVEDSADDTDLLVYELRRAGFNPTWKRVEREADFLVEIKKLPDLILSDYSMPQFDGLRAVKLLRETGLDIPFILISGTVGEDVAVEAMKQGATDYLLKDRIARLGNAVQRALEQKQLGRQQRQAQAELLRAHEALRQMVAHSPAVIYTLKIDGQNVIPVLVSENLERLLGFSTAEYWRPNWWLDGLHPEDRERVLAALAKGIAGDGYSAEYRIRHRNGSFQWIQDSNRVVKDAAGRPRELVGVWTDIDDRKRAEAALRESEAKFRQLAEHIDEVFWITDPNKSQMLYISPGYEKIWGKTCDSLYAAPHTWLESIHPEDRDRILLAALTRQPEGKYDEEYRITRPDQSIRWIRDRAFTVRNPDGSVERVLGVAQDITDRKGLEENLRKSEAEFRVAFLNAAIGMALVDIEGHALKSNPALQQLLGYSEAELRSKVFSEFTHPDDVAADLALYRELLAGGREHYQLEKRYLRQGGEVVYGRLTVSAVRGPAGHAQYAIAMVEDITERKRIEAQFLRAQRLESIGILAGGVAHDLNNVLAPILMSCELLQMKGLDEDARHLLGMIKGSAQRGAELVRQVLSFARGVEGRRLSVQPRHLIGEMVSIARNTFPKSIRVEFHLPKDLWTISGDPTQLHQVLLNLCVNARDAMPLGGQLTIEAENIPGDTWPPGLDPKVQPGSHLVIKVTDTGTGIPPEVREKIFDPFFTTKEVGKGTGLGLSTSLGIVKSHGGFIHLKSEPGKGSTFEVWLPANPRGHPSPAQVVKPRLTLGHGELILVVDDEASLRAITRQTLEAYGYSVLTAMNGVDALAAYARHQDGIAAVLTDVMMPEMDGIALTLALKRLNPDVRVVAASGLSNPEHETKSISAGAKCFLPKPYDVETLLRGLTETLQSR